MDELSMSLRVTEYERQRAFQAVTAGRNAPECGIFQSPYGPIGLILAQCNVLCLICDGLADRLNHQASCIEVKRRRALSTSPPGLQARVSASRVTLMSGLL